MFIQTKSHYAHSLRITKPKIGRFHFHSFEASLTSGINYKEHNNRAGAQVSPSYVRCVFFFNCQENNGPWLKENQKHISPGTQHDRRSFFHQALTLYGVVKFFNSTLLNESVQTCKKPQLFSQSKPPKATKHCFCENNNVRH